MPRFLATIPELVVPSASSWQTIDLSSYFGTGETPAGVLLIVENASTSANYSAGWRCAGATSTVTYTVYVKERHFVWVAISASKTIQLYSGNLTNINFYFAGWVSTAEAYFPVDRWTTSVSDTGTGYSDINPSSIIQGGDTPKVFLGYVSRSSLNDYFYGSAIRPNGSTDALLFPHAPSAAVTFAVSTADGLFEARNDCFGTGTSTAMTVSVVGYLKANPQLVTVTNAETKLTPSNLASWVTVPDTMTLGGKPVADLLSHVVMDNMSYVGDVSFALAGASNDTPLATLLRTPGWAGKGTFQVMAFGHWPLLRSRVSAKTQVVYSYDANATPTTTLLAYSGWAKGSAARAFILGGDF